MKLYRSNSVYYFLLTTNVPLVADEVVDTVSGVHRHQENDSVIASKDVSRESVSVQPVIGASLKLRILSVLFVSRELLLKL